METPQIMDLKEMMHYLKLGRNTVLILLNNNQIQGFKLKGKWRAFANDVVRFLEVEKNNNKDTNQLYKVDNLVEVNGFKIIRKDR